MSFESPELVQKPEPAQVEKGFDYEKDERFRGLWERLTNSGLIGLYDTKEDAVTMMEAITEAQKKIQAHREERKKEGVAVEGYSGELGDKEGNIISKGFGFNPEEFVSK